jgi:membrane protease YdiL (CAAX protease family)
MTETIPPVSPHWGFWATCAWGIGVLAAFYAVQTGAFVALALWWPIDAIALPTDANALASHAVVVSTMTLVSLPATLGIIALPVRLARARLGDYLALEPIDAATIRFGLACTLGYGAAAFILGYAAGRPMLEPFVAELFRTARESGTLPLVLIAAVIAAPLTEELLFRGFLFRGFAASRLGAVGATVVTAAIWAGIHVQYDWFGIGEIFGLGLLFGYLRARTGSTLTTILMHGVYGLAAMIQAAIFAG